MSDMSASDRSRRIARMAVAVAVIVVLIAIAVAALHAPAARSAVSTQGTPVTPSAKDASIIAHMDGLEGSILLIHETSGRAFYRLPRTDGGNCFAMSRASDADHIGMLVCSPDFPSSRATVDFSVFGADKPASDLSVISAQGIASDGVSRVVVLNGNGREIASARVMNNTYVVPAAAGAGSGRTVVALDGQGRPLDRLGQGN